MDWLDIKEFFKDAFKYILLIVGVLLVIIYLVTLEQVIGPSMYPTLKDGNVVILNKVVYRFKSERLC